MFIEGVRNRQATAQAGIRASSGGLKPIHCTTQQLVAGIAEPLSAEFARLGLNVICKSACDTPPDQYHLHADTVKTPLMQTMLLKTYNEFDTPD